MHNVFYKPIETNGENKKTLREFSWPESLGGGFAHAPPAQTGPPMAPLQSVRAPAATASSVAGGEKRED